MEYEKLYEIWERRGVLKKLKENFKSDIDIERLKKEFKNKAETCIAEDGSSYKIMYVGSVYYITPSGKYYTPWACSNVTPKEIIKDELFFEALEEVLEKNDLHLYMEGDEIYIVQ
ncbi:MAG: hypothetical protein DRI33_03245 [Caldiserica bacterium]|nr:MAG: hypothetical protein DRI33_03245 [Caldisericota bacterium]